MVDNRFTNIAVEQDRDASIKTSKNYFSTVRIYDIELGVLKGCEYDLRYDPVGNTTRTRRVII
jgi:hypothetical protein